VFAPSGDGIAGLDCTAVRAVMAGMKASGAGGLQPNKPRGASSRGRQFENPIATILIIKGSSSICVERWQHSRSQEFWAGSTVHCALERLQSVDLPFGLSIAPG
jgi:hypothetical protein